MSQFPFLGVRGSLERAAHKEAKELKCSRLHTDRMQHEEGVLTT